MMQARELEVRNIGIIGSAKVQIDKPLLLFFGDVKQGKTTLLRCFTWVLGGSFPEDILKHGTAEGFIQFSLDDGGPVVIRREFYKSREGETKARSILMTRNGKPIARPSDEIRRYLNPFLLDQDHLRKKTGPDRQKFLVELFGVDTAEEDLKIAAAAREAADLRIQIKAYGEIDLTPVAEVDIEGLKGELAQVKAAHSLKVSEARGELEAIQKKHNADVEAVDKENAATRIDNATIRAQEIAVAGWHNSIDEIDKQIAELQAKRAQYVDKAHESSQWLLEHKAKPEKPRPAMPDVSAIQSRIDAQCDTSAIDDKLRDAGAQNVRAAAYGNNLVRNQARQMDQTRLSALEKQQRDLKAAKLAKLAEIGTKSGIEGLAFADDGSWSFEGAAAEMLSDSQIMRLSQSLSGMYPEGFGIALIDRGESLGRKVTDLWHTAVEQHQTILVSIVGEKPAEVPEQVGAYVVEQGKVS